MGLIDQYQSVGESCSFSLTLADGDTRILSYVNPHFVEKTGFTKNDAIGHSCKFLQADKTPEAIQNYMRTRLESGRPIFCELINYRKDGSPFVNRLIVLEINPTPRVNFYLGLQNPMDYETTEDMKTIKLKTLEDLELTEDDLDHYIRNHLMFLQTQDPKALESAIEKLRHLILNLDDKERYPHIRK
ncbi:MAG: PAS domain-containing protein [Pseudobacteriovorax sp.]|nr:PAS domain-containing protein [Pseudobacteriovorax sp.]